jgi:hypothetical protein
MATKRKKITACEAKARLRASGINPNKQDYFDLRSSDVSEVLDAAKAAGYRKSPSSPKSTARAYFDALRKKRC